MTIVGTSTAPRRRPRRDPLWFKRAVFYEVLVRGFYDSNGDGTGDIRGLTEKLDYLQWLGVDCIWLLPFFQSPLRDGGYDISDYTDGAARVRRPRRLRPASRRGPRARHARDHRLRHEPHQRPAPVVPGQPRTDPDGPFGDFYVWSDTDELLRRRAHHLRRHREAPTGPGTRCASSTSGTGSSATSPTSTSTTPGAGGDARGAALLARPRHRRLPARRRALPLRARGHQRREPARDPRLPQARAQADRRPLPRPGAAVRGQPVAGRRRRVLRRPRRRVPHGLPLPGDAAHLHGRTARAAATRSRRSWRRRRRSRRTASGASSCATTTS